MPLSRNEREKSVRVHMASEIVHDFDTTIGTFSHPHYELVGTESVFDGEDDVRRYFKDSRTPFPDQSNEIIKLHHTDTDVIVEFWLTGTHTGPLKTKTGVVPPSGKSFRVRMLAIFEFDDTGIVCERVYFDQGSILRQIGIAA